MLIPRRSKEGSNIKETSEEKPPIEWHIEKIFLMGIEEYFVRLYTISLKQKERLRKKR